MHWVMYRRLLGGYRIKRLYCDWVWVTATDSMHMTSQPLQAFLDRYGIFNKGD